MAYDHKGKNYLDDLGVCLCKLKRFKKATKVYGKAIKFDLLNPKHYVNKGIKSFQWFRDLS